MDTRIIWAVAALCAALAQASTVDDTHYVAAVVDFCPAPYVQDMTPLQAILANIGVMEFLMAEAEQKKVDIIVFPEDGLQSQPAGPYPMSIPSAEDNATPCQDVNSDQPLRNLSCMAAKHSMYLVVNLVHQVPCKTAQDPKCPTRGFYNYNTNVAFDRNGKIIARYHKYNLFGERNNNVPPSVEYVTFDTDFGVRFGMFICFDILFDKPAAALARERNVTDFVFSANWFSEVPFLSAVQAHSGWAHSLDVTLLSAAFNFPAVGSTGSGIYRGRQGIMAYVFNPRAKTTMLVKSVPKHGHWDSSFTALPYENRLDPMANYGTGAADPFESVKGLRMKQDNFTMYTTRLLPRPKDRLFEEWNSKICTNGFCCTAYSSLAGTTLSPSRSAAASVHGATSRARAAAKAEMVAEEDVAGVHYRLVAFSGVRDHSHVASTGVQICGVMSCGTDQLSSCGWNIPHLNDPAVLWTEFLHLRVSAEFDAEDTLQFASTQAGPRYDTLPAYAYKFSSTPSTEDSTKQRVDLVLKKAVTDLRTFAIYGRKFAWDGNTPTGQ